MMFAESYNLCDKKKKSRKARFTVDLRSIHVPVVAYGTSLAMITVSLRTSQACSAGGCTELFQGTRFLLQVGKIDTSGHAYGVPACISNY